MSSRKFVKRSFFYFVLAVLVSLIVQTTLMSIELKESFWLSIGMGMVFWLADCLFYISRHCKGGES